MTTTSKSLLLKNRFPCTLKIAGTKTFRLSSSKFFEMGGNAQNFSKEDLDIFTAPEGCSFIQVDQAGAEARVFAYETEPGRFRELFDSGVKPHTYMALHLDIDTFRGSYQRERYWCQTGSSLKSLEEWRELSKRVAADKMYFLGKKTIHASNYCMGANTFRTSVLKETEGRLVLSYQEAREMLEMYGILFPENIDLQNRIKLQVETHGYIENLFGDRRPFRRKIDESYLRDAVSWLFQSTVGCITHQAFVAFQNQIEKEGRDWHLVNNKHDSYIAVVPDTDIPEAAESMTRHMACNLRSTRGEDYEMLVEASVGKNLKDMEDYG